MPTDETKTKRNNQSGEKGEMKKREEEEQQQLQEGVRVKWGPISTIYRFFFLLCAKSFFSTKKKKFVFNFVHFFYFRCVVFVQFLFKIICS